MAVGPEGSIFLAANWRGLWVLDARGSLSLLTETACSAIAYDPTGDKVYCTSGSDDLFAFDRKIGATTSLERAPELSGRIEDIDVGRSGKLYGVGELWHEDVIFEFDPGTESWSEVALGPRFLWNLAVSEDRLLALASPVGLVAMPVDDGPPVIPVSRDLQP